MAKCPNCNGDDVTVGPSHQGDILTCAACGTFVKTGDGYKPTTTIEGAGGDDAEKTTQDSQATEADSRGEDQPDVVEDSSTADSQQVEQETHEQSGVEVETFDINDD